MPPFGGRCKEERREKTCRYERGSCQGWLQRHGVHRRVMRASRHCAFAIAWLAGVWRKVAAWLASYGMTSRGAKARPTAGFIAIPRSMLEKHKRWCQWRSETGTLFMTLRLVHQGGGDRLLFFIFFAGLVIIMRQTVLIFGYAEKTYAKIHHFTFSFFSPKVLQSLKLAVSQPLKQSQHSRLSGYWLVLWDRLMRDQPT